jgi:hypothetical protein
VPLLLEESTVSPGVPRLEEEPKEEDDSLSEGPIPVLSTEAGLL